MTDEFGETFVSAYVEFRNKLTRFLDAKRTAKFEKQLSKGAKFVDDYLDWVAEGVSGDILLDLHYEYENGDADLTPATEKAMEQYEALMDITGTWIALVELCGGRKKVSKNFVKYRKQIREFIDQQVEAAVVVDPVPVSAQVVLDGESEPEPEPPPAA